jgi:hypothetical protein
MIWNRSRISRALGGPLGDDGQIGLPHVRAHELDPCSRGLAEPVEEPMQGRPGALFSDPGQAPTPLVDLVDQGT